MYHVSLAESTPSRMGSAIWPTVLTVLIQTHAGAGLWVSMCKVANIGVYQRRISSGLLKLTMIKRASAHIQLAFDLV